MVDHNVLTLRIFMFQLILLLDLSLNPREMRRPVEEREVGDKF